jgi:hypothetical protein
LIEIATVPIMKKLPDRSAPAEMVLPRLVTRTLRERYSSLTEEGRAQGRVAHFSLRRQLFQDGVGDAVIGL